MPHVLSFGRFVLYFWAGENDEPIHVHAAVKRPSRQDAKFWLTADVMRFIVQNHEYIVSKWTAFYGGIEPKFYC